MTNFLFSESEMQSESPRLAWLKKHGIQTHYAPHMAGDEGHPWCAWDYGLDPYGNGIPGDPEYCGYGETEDEAICNLAILRNLKLWNEETHEQIIH